MIIAIETLPTCMGDTSRRGRDASGQFTESLSSADVLQFIEDSWAPAVTRSDIATEFGVSTETAKSKIHELWINTNVAKHSTGGTKIGGPMLYWRINEFDEPDDDADLYDLKPGMSVHVGGEAFDFPLWYRVTSTAADGQILELEPLSQLETDARSADGPAMYDIEREELTIHMTNEKLTWPDVGVKIAREHGTETGSVHNTNRW